MAYFTDDSLLPENMPPLIITAAPYAAPWLPQDAPPGHIPVSWNEQVQAAVDCFNAGARVLHIHVRDPKTGHISLNFDDYGYLIGLLRKAVPDMILQLGGSISFTPEAGKSSSSFASYDERHRMALITPKPDQITVSVGSSLYDLTALHSLDDSFAGTHLDNPAALQAMVNLVADATPAFYLEEIKLCVDHGIQPYFALPHIHGLELVERLIRRGHYKGPVSGFFSTGGGGICGANPFDLLELVRRTPQGSCFTYQTTFRLTFAISMMMIALGQHTRAGLEDNRFGPVKGSLLTSVQMIEKQVSMAAQIDRPIATPQQAREMLKIGVSYDTTEETLANLGLPPNRHPDQKGFLVLETDGTRSEPVHAGSDGHLLAV